MSKALIDKIRRAREQRVPVGDMTFIIRRPTDLEVGKRGGGISVDDVFQYVLGWEGVREVDVIPGGDPHPLPFDVDLCAEWLADRLDVLGTLSNAVRDLYLAHRQAQDAAVKN